MTALLVVAVAAAVAYTLGLRTAEQPGAAGERDAEQPGAARERDAERRSAAATRQPEAAGGMDEHALWKLITDSRTKSDDDTGRQAELLEERLARLPARDIADFQRIRHRLDKRAYTWDLWGAAYVIEDGCSDDCFRDFRGYLISLGRKAYDAALRDPDSLAPIVEDAETDDWENADSVAADAYESATGDDLPVDDSDLSGDPRGEPWDDEHVEALIERYPRLAEKFR